MAPCTLAEGHGRVLHPRDSDPMASGEQAHGMAHGGRIQELITTGGPTPSLAVSHDQALHLGILEPMDHGGHARGIEIGGQVPSIATSKPPASEPKSNRSPTVGEINMATPQAEATLANLKWSEITTSSSSN